MVNITNLSVVESSTVKNSIDNLSFLSPSLETEFVRQLLGWAVHIFTISFIHFPSITNSSIDLLDRDGCDIFLGYNVSSVSFDQLRLLL